MRTSQNGINLIKSFEGCRLTAYQDQVGVLTIGYGHTGKDVSPNETITEEEAEQLLVNDLVRFETGVSSLLQVAVTQNEFDALVCFSYNLGLGSLHSSTLLRKLNAGDIDGAAAEFVKWDRAGGVEVAGLLRRRQAEAALFQQQ